VARERAWLRSIALLSSGNRTPRRAILVSVVISAAIIPLGDLALLAELSSFAALLAFLVTNVTVIVLRYRMPDLRRPFRVPLSMGRMPLLPLISIASIVGLCTRFDPAVYLGGALVVALSSVAWLIQRRLRPLDTPGDC